MKDTFKTIITDFHEKEMPVIIEREISVPIDSSKIITLVGARRTGKTYLFYDLIKKLRKEHNVTLINYINFEDDRIFPTTLSDLNLYIDAYYELFPTHVDKTIYFFFDEIQNIENWEKFIRRIYDTLNCKLFITGSSSKFLSKEIATSLRGRTISFEVFPFSFTEYLRFNEIKTDFYSSKNRSKIINAFDQYLYGSSFPELITSTVIEKPKILREYLDLIIYKDLIERYNINNLYLIKYLIKFLITNTSNPISITKIYNDIKSQGIKVSKNSLFQYFEYLEDAYIIFSVKLFSNNLREIQRNYQKIYSIDSGLMSIVTIDKNIGRRFENIVYLELRRKINNIAYFKEKQEIDFCYQTNDGINLVNVSFSIENKSTKEREIKGLIEGMNTVNANQSTLITNSHEEELIIDNKKINIIPLWKWLIAQEI